MSSRWFRLYDELLDDPKVQLLPDRLFRLWINLLCVASRENGTFHVTGLAFRLRVSEAELTADLDALVTAKLIDRDGETVSPHNWNRRQFRSDSSTERVRKHRQRSAPVSRNDGETLHETPPDTDTEKKRPNGRFFDGRKRAAAREDAQPTRPTTWLLADDPRWKAIEQRWRGEHQGRGPPKIGGAGGQGWHVPTAWLDELVAA